MNFWGWTGCRLCWNTEGILGPVDVMVCQGKCALGEGGYATEGEKWGVYCCPGPAVLSSSRRSVSDSLTPPLRSAGWVLLPRQAFCPEISNDNQHREALACTGCLQEADCCCMHRGFAGN